jgi:hypothetical protein
MKKLFINILRIITNIFRSLIYNLDIFMSSFSDKDVKLTVIEFSDNNRYLYFELTNNKLLNFIRIYPILN